MKMGFSPGGRPRSVASATTSTGAKSRLTRR